MDFDIASMPEARQAALRAQTARQPVLTPQLTLVQGEQALATYLPLFRDGQFTGLLIGVIRVDPWLDAVLIREIAFNYYISISIGGAPVYGIRDDAQLFDNPLLEKRALSLYGTDWTIRVLPKARLVSFIRSWLSTAVLILGLTLSVLLGWIVHAGLKAKHQAHQLENSARRLTTLMKNLPGMAFRFVQQEKWPAEFVSEGCREICGYSKRELEEQRIFWIDLVHPADRSDLLDSVRQAAEQDRDFENEYRITTRDGEEKWVWSYGRTMDAEDHETVYLEGLVTDITSRKRDATALVDAEAYAKAVVDTAAEAVITMDAGGRIETFNRAAQQMFSYTFEEITGKNISVLMP